MMQRLTDLPIRLKLSFIVLLATGLVIAFMGAVFIIERNYAFRRSMVENISTLAAVVGINSTAALAFDEVGTGAEILAALSAEPDVLEAHIFHADGRLFGSYHTANPPSGWERSEGRAALSSLATAYQETRKGYDFHGDLLDLNHPIQLNHKIIGHVAIRADLTRLRDRLRLFVLLTACATFGVMALAYLLCARLNRFITDPVTQLVDAMEQVSSQGDYSLRVAQLSNDEHGKLVAGFNFMLSQIQQRDEELARHGNQLEDLVSMRTKALEQANEKLRQEIDHRQETQRALARAQKMEAIGTLAAGVAHDLNNILSGISSYPELLLATLPQESPLRSPLATIKKSGEKAAAIVQDMLALARRSVISLETINLEAEIRAFLAGPEIEKQLSIHPRIHIRTDFAAELANIEGSSVHLHKVFMNLVVNAMEAMPEGGRIEVATKTMYIDRPIRGYDEVQAGEYVCLDVSDNGTGIAPEDLDQIFEPFFSRKQMGRSGTGLGMAVVWGTVKDHNGYIEVKSELGRGTSFSLLFPLSRQALVPREVDRWETHRGRGERILVVDDAESQRAIASEILKTLGYTVTAVESGEAAVSYLETHAVDLVLLDMIMPPGINGYETYRRIIVHHPGQRALIASGYSESDQVKAAQRLGAGEYIRKPYTLAKIAAAVRRSMDNPPAGATSIGD